MNDTIIPTRQTSSSFPKPVAQENVNWAEEHHDPPDAECHDLHVHDDQQDLP